MLVKGGTGHTHDALQLTLYPWHIYVISNLYKTNQSLKSAV